MAYFQHGDVLLHIETFPKGKKLARVECAGTLQKSDVTGHAHKLHGKGFQVLEAEDKARFVRVETETPLRHEEHKEILLPPGEYRVGFVQEYDHLAEEARAVID